MHEFTRKQVSAPHRSRFGSKINSNSFSNGSFFVILLLLLLLYFNALIFKKSHLILHSNSLTFDTQLQLNVQY